MNSKPGIATDLRTSAGDDAESGSGTAADEFDSVVKSLWNQFYHQRVQSGPARGIPAVISELMRSASMGPGTGTNSKPASEPADTSVEAVIAAFGLKLCAAIRANAGADGVEDHAVERARRLLCAMLRKWVDDEPMGRVGRAAAVQKGCWELVRELTDEANARSRPSPNPQLTADAVKNLRGLASAIQDDIRLAQKKSPSDKLSFAKEITKQLINNGLAIELPEGRLATLTFAPGGNEKGYIQFRIIGGKGKRGPFKSTPIKVVAVTHAPSGKVVKAADTWQ